MSVDYAAIAKDVAGGSSGSGSVDYSKIAAEAAATPTPHATSSSIDYSAIAHEVAATPTPKPKPAPSKPPSNPTPPSIAPSPRPSVAAMAFASKDAPRTLPMPPGTIVPFSKPGMAGALQPSARDNVASPLTAAGTTALQTAGDYISLGTPGGGLAGAALRDDFASPNFAGARAEAQRFRAANPQATNEQVRAHAVQWLKDQRALPKAVSTLVRGHLSPEAVHAVNEHYSTFGPENMEATGVGPAIRHGVAAAEGGVRGALAPLAGEAHTGLAFDPAVLAKIASDVAKLDPHVVESALTGTGEFVTSLGGPGNEIPGLLARGTKGLAARGIAAARDRAPQTVAKIEDALGTAPVVGSPYHDLLKDVAPDQHARARALARLYDTAPQAAKGKAQPMLQAAFGGLPSANGDAAAHRVIDAYQALAHKKIVDAASDEDRALALDLRARHADDMAQGLPVSPRVRELADQEGRHPAWLKELIPDDAHDLAGAAAEAQRFRVANPNATNAQVRQHELKWLDKQGAARRTRVLSIADAMEHADRMPANLTPDEIRRAGILEQNEAIVRTQLAKYPGLLEDTEAVPGYFTQKGGWRFKDEVPGAPVGGAGRREAAVNTSYRNPARYRTVAEARQYGPAELGAAPFSNLSPRQAYLLDLQRKWENVARLRAYQALGQLPSRTPGRFLREMPTYQDPLTGDPLTGPVQITNRRGTRMVDPLAYAKKRAAEFDQSVARDKALYDMGIDPLDIPKRRPTVITPGHVAAVERAANAADALAAQAGRDTTKAIERTTSRAHQQERAAATGAERVAGEVQRGGERVNSALGKGLMRSVDAAEAGRTQTAALAERVRKLVMQKVSRTFRATPSRKVNAALLSWAQERIDNPAYVEQFTGTAEDAQGNVVAIGRKGNSQRAKGVSADSYFTAQDAREAAAWIKRETNGRIAPTSSQAMDWLHSAHENLMAAAMKLPPEYRSIVGPAVQRRTETAAGAIEKTGNAIADRSTNAAIAGAERGSAAVERSANRTLRAIDRERMKQGNLRDAHLSATVGDVDRILERVQRNAAKFTDRVKSVGLSRDLGNQKRAVLDELEARLKARRGEVPRSGQDLIMHLPGYSKVSDLGLGIPDEPDAQVVDGLRKFLERNRVSPDIGTPVSETLGTLNSLARSSLVFNPVIHTLNNQGSIYLALTGDVTGLRDATSSLIKSGPEFEDFIRSHKFSNTPGDTMARWDRLAQDYGAWHPSAHGSRGMGTEASIERDASGQITGYHAPPGAERGDFATTATEDIGDIGGRGALHAAVKARDVGAAASLISKRATKLGYELQKWNSDVVFNRGERVYAASLMRHFVQHEGLDPAEAANRVREAFGTDMLTDWERQTLVKGMFFYPWLRTVMSLSLKLGLSKPQTWNAPLEGTRVQRETVGAGGVRMSRSNPFTLAAPNADGGFGYYGVPLFNRVLEPMARMVTPPEPQADLSDRFGPMASYLTGHLPPAADMIARGAAEAISPHGLPDYLDVVDPDASPHDMFIQAMRNAAGSVFYPMRAAEDAVTNPGSIVPTALGGSVGTRGARTIDDLSASREKFDVRDLNKRLKAAQRRGDQATADRLQRDLDYQRSRQ